MAPALLAVLGAFGCDESQANAEPRNEATPTEETKVAEGQADAPTPSDTSVEDPEAGLSPKPPEADPNEPPADYGAIKPPMPIPVEADLKLYALADFTIVTIYSKPDLKSPRLGYLRRGQRVKVTEKLDDEGEGCATGFHGLPTGGFACASKGLVVNADKEPYMHRPPPAPRKTEPVPYDYAVVSKQGAPMWWRVPDTEEVALAQLRYDETIGKIKKKEAAEKAKTKTKTKAKTKTKTTMPKNAGRGEKVADAEQAEDVLPGVGDEPKRPLTAEERKAAAKLAAERIEAEKKRRAELEIKWNKLPLHPQRPFMERGNMISIGSRVRDKGRTWWRTARGGYVQSAHTYRYGSKDFAGGEIAEGSGFPFGFVWAEDGVASQKLVGEGKLKWSGKLAHRTFVDAVEEVEIDGRAYLKTADDLYVRKKVVRLAVKQERPKDVQIWEKWIDVDLEQQILVAYEGDVPRYATLVSTGRKGSKEESFRTPKGEFRIRSKHISSSMAGSTATDGDYSIQDVPWAMFFEGNYALHGAFWHTRFGRVRSHGCVNLGPSDAKWLFDFATPNLPDGWHGVSAHEGSPGTLVVVH